VSHRDTGGFSIDHGDVGDFTKGILSWWESHACKVGAWSEAARIAFAMPKTPFRFSRSCL
jgi:hypothetical protein